MLIGYEQIASMLGISTRHAQKLVSDGVLPRPAFRDENNFARFFEENVLKAIEEMKKKNALTIGAIKRTKKTYRRKTI